MRTLVVLALPLLLAACGTDEPQRADETPVADTPPPTSPESPSETATPTLGDDPLLTLTADELCAALTVDAATAAIGSEVAVAEASASETPQCTYTYGGDSASLTTFTVAAQRPADVGGRGLGDAFDHVLDVNRDLAVDTGVVESTVEAGDRAVSLTGETLTLTVVASGGHLLTLVTTPDLDAAAVAALSAAVADGVG